MLFFLLLGRSCARPVAIAYKRMAMTEAIAAAKKIQQRHEVTSAYQPKPKIQTKHAQHRASVTRAPAISAPAPAPAAVAPAPVGKHVTAMTADEVSDGTDVVFHDFDAKAYSSADAREIESMEQEEKNAQQPAAARRNRPVPRSHVPVPADYARGLIVQPAHTDVNGFATAAATAEHAKVYGSSTGSAAARSRRSSPSTPSSISSAAAKAQIYNNDEGIKVVTGTEGDNVASGVGGGVGGQQWVRTRQARIAAARGEAETQGRKSTEQTTKRATGNSRKVSPHSKTRRAAPHKSQKGRASHPRNLDANFDNDANVKVVDGTEGDNVASGMGGSIDGASWVAARKERIAREGGVQSPIGSQDQGANTYKGETAYPGDQGRDVAGARRLTAEDVERTVGTNIVFHNIKNEGGIARGQARRVGIRYDDSEMY